MTAGPGVLEEVLSSTQCEPIERNHCDISTCILVDDTCFVGWNITASHTFCVSALDFFYYLHPHGAVFLTLFYRC